MNPKKRLLYIGNKLAEHGKPPSSIDLLSTKLQAEGFEVITASSKLNKLQRLWEMVVTTYKYRKKVDGVLLDTYSTQNFLYAVIVSRLCRIFKLPYIPILHGGNLPHRLKYNKRQSQNLFVNAKTNVAPSKFMFEKFREKGFTNLTYIPNAIPIDDYPFKLRESVGLKLLWVRSFSEIYNPKLAIEIVALLQKKGREVSLCMVGPDKDGSLQRCKKMAAELNLPVTFTGLLSKQEWIARSQHSDIFINTTNFDNMPVSVMEAMALGLPVVSTNVGGLPFMITDKADGLLVPPNNPEAFVEAIEFLCENNEKTQQMAVAARKKVEAFDWKKIKQQWITLLGY